MTLCFAIAIWGMLLSVAVLSGKEQGSLLSRMSIWIYKRMSMIKIFGSYMRKQDRKVKQTLRCLHPGESSARLLTEYYTEKIKMVVFVLAVGSALACGADLSKETSGTVLFGETVSRGDKGQLVMLEAAVKDDKEVIREEIVLEVAERQLRPEEAENLYEQFVTELEELMPGENPSLQEIRENVSLPYEVKGYPFVIEWHSSNTELLREDGEIHTEDLEEPAKVILRADVIYMDQVWRNDWELTLMPPVRTEWEQLMYDLGRQSEELERESRFEDHFELPDTIRGKQVFWTMKKESAGPGILLLTVAAAAAVYCLKDWDLQGELTKRRSLMKQEYPVFVSKYALLLGAGMTVRGAFLKICKDSLGEAYNISTVKGGAAGGKKARMHPLYEEMLYSCNELMAGVPESKVYENFGRRTGVQEFTRLCTLLNQNLKKGNTELVHRLKEECEETTLENMQFRKRLGEEAGTKLLFPMIMMLVMVLLMIMLPAFSGLGL